MPLETYLLWMIYYAACYGKKLRRNVLLVQKPSFQKDFNALQSYLYQS